MIVTGGQKLASRSRVQEYNLQGSVARLPDLHTGRRKHACGYYVNKGQIVSTELIIDYEFRSKHYYNYYSCIKYNTPGRFSKGACCILNIF